MAVRPEMNPDLTYSENEQELYPDCPCEKKNSCSKTCSTCNSGITLEITEQRESPYSFKKAVVVVVAIEKLKLGARRGSIFSDMDLLDLINNIFVQEIPYDNCHGTYASGSTYRHFASQNFTIKDSSSKCLVLQEFSGSAKLVALQLQGINKEREEKIKMEFYSARALNGGKKQPIALGLLGRNLYLSCSSVDGTPELHLKRVSNLKTISQDFIFLRSETSPSHTSKANFESAAFPGWYISTSQRENELVKMTHQREQTHINEFILFP
ncbi:interleukin-1 beta-like isoform 2-T2 [Discoglossus pictus]